MSLGSSGRGARSQEADGIKVVIVLVLEERVEGPSDVEVPNRYRRHERPDQPIQSRTRTTTRTRTTGFLPSLRPVNNLKTIAVRILKEDGVVILTILRR
jgi:hypothetical protein